MTNDPMTNDPMTNPPMTNHPIALWLTLLVIGLVTFGYRFAFIFFLDYLRLPAWLARPLRFVPIAALTAIIVPELFVRNNVVAVSWSNERLLAGLIAIGVAWWTRNTLLTIGLGMAALYGLQWLLAA